MLLLMCHDVILVSFWCSWTISFSLFSCRIFFYDVVGANHYQYKRLKKKDSVINPTQSQSIINQ